MSTISDLWSDSDAETASKAVGKAANAELQYKREALNYMKEREAVPQRLREGALNTMGTLYMGDASGQQNLIDRAKGSPLYSHIMGGQEAGEEAIMRHASATGGLRSGTTQENLYDYNTQLQNNALLESYNEQVRGLGGLAQLPSLAPMIAAQTSDIGRTYANKYTAQGQAMQGDLDWFDSILSGVGDVVGLLGSSGSGSGGGGMSFSDRRLKENIEKIGERFGFNWYSWDWNEEAKDLGLNGSSEGWIADEIKEKFPDAIVMKDGYMMINYPMVGDANV